jgi:acetyl esterase/lipase
MSMDSELEALREQTIEENEKLRPLIEDRKFHTVSVAEARQLALAETKLENAVDVSVPSPNGPILIHTFSPPSPKGVYMHIHGGGWVIGSAFARDQKLFEISQQTNSVVVSVDYRLAPENPYPSGADDCEEAAAWLLENSEKKWGTSQIVIGGESAGAHLAAVTALRLRNRHALYKKIVGLNLVYGVFDLSMTPSQRLGNDTLVISTETLEWFYNHYLQSNESRVLPDISPLFADLSELPPALLSVGTQDPLLDDSLFMAMRLRAAGSEATLDIYPEALHGFTVLPGRAATVANERANQFISSCWS